MQTFKTVLKKFKMNLETPLYFEVTEIDTMYIAVIFKIFFKRHTHRVDLFSPRRNCFWQFFLCFLSTILCFCTRGLVVISFSHNVLKGCG